MFSTFFISHVLLTHVRRHIIKCIQQQMHLREALKKENVFSSLLFKYLFSFLVRLMCIDLTGDIEKNDEENLPIKYE